MILSGGWQAGRKLPSQRELAERLGISRPTIREALIVMETRGEVHTQPGKGVYVARPLADADGPKPQKPAQGPRPAVALSAGKAAQMYQFRYAIEPAVAGLVAVNATMAQIEDLRQLSTRMREALARNDLALLAQLDFAFHGQLVEAANNPFFTQAIAPSLDMFSESQQLPFANDAAIGDTVLEHEALVEALRKRSPAEARQAMRAHILGAASRAGILFTQEG